MKVDNQVRQVRRESIFNVAFAAPLACSVKASVDVEAAKGLAQESSCFKCHGVDKKNDSHAYKQVAEKYRGKASPESIKNHAGWILSLYPGSLRQFKNGKSFVREM